MPLDAPDEHPFTVFPLRGEGLWDGKTLDGSSRPYLASVSPLWSLPSRPGKYPSCKHLFAMARNNPRSRKMAAWHISEVNPSIPGAFGIECLKGHFTSAPVKAGPSRTRYPKPPAGGYFRRFVFLVPCGTDHPCRHGHQKKDTIPYALPCPGRCKTVSSSSSGHPLLPVHKPPWLSHIPRPHTGVCWGCVSDATLLVFASFQPLVRDSTKGASVFASRRFRGMAVSHACLTHSVYRSTTSSSRSHRFVCRKEVQVGPPPVRTLNVTALWSEDVTPRTTCHSSALSSRAGCTSSTVLR
ncbi:hypothetical protein EVAR_57751_1 [Eumeta japonica]|uniref:Uncharacterized protein n=1 Tax=Eumeta variegata TaxID=151549 RepID=A0A4C1ZW71_EUMVA|nr:hypothetical protein EVAR_57751_1 [Eumeta japonica]